MRNFNLLLVATLLFALFFNASSHAQDSATITYQSSEEQQRIREMRLLEWHAQQQGHGQTSQNHNQGNYQNTSLNQPYQPAAVATPEREDLFDAANAGNIQQISKLLSQGLDINVSNAERETALHMAAARGHFQAVMFLVKKGAWINAPTVKNWIPLHHAVRFRHPNIVNFLIQRGSSASARTSDGMSAIDMARNNRDFRILGIMRAR